MNPEKKVIIIAGPNGAGKTTFAEEFLPAEAGVPIFVNADLIAAGLSRKRRLELRRIERWRAKGYIIELIFLSLSSV